jgi:hypothetical protein
MSGDKAVTRNGQKNAGIFFKTDIASSPLLQLSPDLYICSIHVFKTILGGVKLLLALSQVSSKLVFTICPSHLIVVLDLCSPCILHMFYCLTIVLFVIVSFRRLCCRCEVVAASVAAAFSF